MSGCTYYSRYNDKNSYGSNYLVNHFMKALFFFFFVLKKSFIYVEVKGYNRFQNLVMTCHFMVRHLSKIPFALTLPFKRLCFCEITRMKRVRSTAAEPPRCEDSQMAPTLKFVEITKLA